MDSKVHTPTPELTSAPVAFEPVSLLSLELSQESFIAERNFASSPCNHTHQHSESAKAEPDTKSVAADKELPVRKARPKAASTSLTEIQSSDTSVSGSMELDELSVSALESKSDISSPSQELLASLVNSIQSQEIECNEPTEKPGIEGLSGVASTESAAPEMAQGAQEAQAPALSSQELERLSHLDLKEGDVCPACGRGYMVLKKGEKMSFLGCSCYPECKMRAFVSSSFPVVTLKTLQSECPQCGEALAVKKGRYGLFIGCSNYPECNYTYKDHGAAGGLACPLCNKGTLERKRARSGRTFYCCTNYPKCTFLLPGEPVAKQCPECAFPVRFCKKVKAGTALVCGNPLCASRKRRKYDLLSAHA